MSFFYPQAGVILRVIFEDHQVGLPIDVFPLTPGIAADQKSVSPVPDRKPAPPPIVHTLAVQCRRVVVNINDYRQADTFSCEIDYKNFPFDPRCMKAIGISIFIQDQKKIYNSDNSLNFINPGEDNCVFQGFADEEGIKLDDNQRLVTIEGRDFTALLADQPFLKGTLDLGKPINDLILSLLRGLKSTEKLKVENRTGVDPMPTLSQFYPDFGAMSAQKNTQRDDTYWDVIQDVIGRAGFIGYIEIDRLVISKPRDLYSGLARYQFIYGKNLTSLEFKRKLSKQKGFNLIVRSFNPNDKKNPVIAAKIPEEATDHWLAQIGLPRKAITIKKPVGPGGSGNNTQSVAPVQVPNAPQAGTGAASQSFVEEVAPYLAFNVPNVTSKDHLIQIGQSAFEEIGRQQIEGSLQTKEMAQRQQKKPLDPESEALEFNICKIRNGTPVVISIDQGDMKGLSQIKEKDYRTTVEARRKFLIAHGYAPAVAQGLAESLGRFHMTFYTKSVEFTMDQDSGFEMKLEFVNFIDITGRALVK